MNLNAQIIDKFKEQTSPFSLRKMILMNTAKLKYGKSETLSTLMLLYPSLFAQIHEDHMYRKVNSESHTSENGRAGRQLDTYIDLNDISNSVACRTAERGETQYRFLCGLTKSKLRTQIRFGTHDSLLAEMDYTYPNFLDFERGSRCFVN